MRVSIITGGGSGIGAAVARRLAASDQCLVLHGQGADAAGLERLKTVATECERVGAKVEWRTGDLAKEGTASELVHAARAAFGPVDAIVHAAGFADKRKFGQLPRAGLERAFAVMAAAFHELADAWRAGSRRRRQQFCRASFYARSDLSGLGRRESSARSTGALSCDRACAIRRHRQCRSPRLYAQRCRAVGRAGPQGLAIRSRGKSDDAFGRAR